MTDSVPSMAFGSPPLTGASSISIPLAFSALRFPDCQRRNGAHIDHHGARFRPFNNAVFTQRHLFNMRRVRQMVMITLHCSESLSASSRSQRQRRSRSAIASGLRSDTTSE